MIAGGNFEIVKPPGQIYILQFPRGSRCDVSRKALGLSTEKQVSGAAISEGLDHGTMYRVT